MRDLIRERVHHEVREFNRQQGKLTFDGLVQPSDAEQELNGSQTLCRLKPYRILYWETPPRLTTWLTPRLLATVSWRRS